MRVHHSAIGHLITFLYRRDLFKSLSAFYRTSRNFIRSVVCVFRTLQRASSHKRPKFEKFGMDDVLQNITKSDTFEGVNSRLLAGRIV